VICIFIDNMLTETLTLFLFQITSCRPPEVPFDVFNANILSPILTFTAPMDQFTIHPLSTLESTSSDPSSELPVGLLLFQSVSGLDEYWHLQWKLLQKSVVTLERLACLSLAQIIGVVLALHDCGHPVTRLHHGDVVYVQRDASADWYPVVRMSVVGSICLERDAAAVCDDATLLILRMLCVDTEKGDRTLSPLSAPRTLFSRVLQRAARLLKEKTWESLSTARDVIEYTLWGPPEDEAKIAAMTEDRRETAFRLWLDVTRCRLLSQLVLDANSCGLETGNQVRYLCRMTDTLLLDTTKHLFV